MIISPIVSKQKYESVADQIILMIRNNTFTEGSHLPSESELASQFNVGRSSSEKQLRVFR